MRTITMLAQKGGCGRSTLATQLAVWATQQDELACVVDLDPQGSAALWRSFRTAKLPLVQRALSERLPQVAKEAEDLGVTTLLVDTPPHLDKTALEAIRIADLVICPTKPDLLTLGALADTVALLDAAAAKGKVLAVINDVPTAAKAREAALASATAALKKFHLPIARTTISHSPQMVAAVGRGLGITEALPKNATAKEIAALWAEIAAAADLEKEAAQ
jgi:chromosome partitioning protein